MSRTRPLIKGSPARLAVPGPSSSREYSERISDHSPLPALHPPEKIRIQKPTYTKHTVAKSDSPNIINSDISFNTFSRTTGSMQGANTSDFEPNRPNEFLSKFINKCEYCKFMIDLTPAKSNDRETKSLLLKQLTNVFQYPVLIRKMNVQCVESLIGIFSTNLCRDFPPVSAFPPSILSDRIESFYDEAWTQVSLVYTLFNTFLSSSHVPPQFLNACINTSFIAKLYKNFESPDDRERQEVKTILFALCSRLPELLCFVLQCIKYSFTDRDQRIVWGLPQILELFLSLAQSVPQIAFANPEDVVCNLLLPLYLLPTLSSNSENLRKCIDFTVQRSSTLGELVVSYLLHHLPICSQKKQLIFLEHLEFYINNYWQSLSPNCATKAITRITRLFIDSSSEISQRALSIFFEDGCAFLIRQYYSKLAPIVMFRAKQTRDHWCEDSQIVGMALMQEISRMDKIGFNELRDVPAPSVTNQKREEMWNLLKNPPDQSVTQLQPLQSQPSLEPPLDIKKKGTKRLSRSHWLTQSLSRTAPKRIGKSSAGFY